jgi:glycosyltransferase involved in cell wall biosynthesis
MQSAMGHRVTVLTSDHGETHRPREETRAGYTLRRYRQTGEPFGNSITPGLVTDLRRLFDQFDIVHAHSHLYFSTNAAAAVARTKETPFVVTNHGLLSQSAPKWLQSGFLHTVSRFTFDSADRVFCYTTTDRDRLRQLGVSAPIAVVPNGIDTEMFTPAAATSRRRRLLYVGRLKRAKGVGRVLSAFERLSDSFPDLELAIVGTGPLSEELSERVRANGLDDRVTLTGRVDNEDLPPMYAGSQVFALPSEAEGLPRTVLESLSCGTPVVTSDLPQLESVVSGAGFTVPKGSVDELSAAIRRLLTDATLRERLGRVGRERVVSEHTWSETVNGTTEEYYDVV